MWNPISKSLFVALAACLAGTIMAPAQPVVDTTPAALERNELLSRLQQMSHGYYTQEQWQEAYDEIHRLLDAAERAGDHAEVIDVTLLLARVQSDMRGLHTDALYTLSRLKDRFINAQGLPMGRVYAALAEVHAKLGNAPVIEALIEEFRAGPHYDPVDYEVSGGRDPTMPVRVVRPAPGGDDSVTVTIMRRHLRQAGQAPGTSFPAFRLTTRTGQVVSNADFAGRVLLVDFYAPNWPAWQADLPYLQRLHERHRAAGFEILGVSIDPREMRADAATSLPLPWAQVVGDRELRRQCGVLGAPQRFLLDKQGRIVARNPSIPELEDLLARLL